MILEEPNAGSGCDRLIGLFKRKNGGKRCPAHGLYHMEPNILCEGAEFPN